MLTPLRVVPLPPGLVAILPPEAGDDFAAQSLVIRLPSLSELHRFQALALADDQAGAEAAAYELANLSPADIERMDHRVRAALDDAIGAAIADALAEAQRAASE